MSSTRPNTGPGPSHPTRPLIVPAIAVAAAVLLSVPSAGAHTTVPKPFKEASISFSSAGSGRAGAGDGRDSDATTLRVEHDGTRYTRLDGKVTAVFRLRAKVKTRHRIYGWVVTTGDPDFRNLIPDAQLGALDSELDTRKLDTQAAFAMDAATAVTTGAGAIGTTTVGSIIEKCNDAFPNLPPADQAIDQIELTVHAGFAAGKKKKFSAIGNGEGPPLWFGGLASGRPAIAETKLKVNIVCAGKPAGLAKDQPKRAGNTLHAIDFQVDQHGERCPKDVTVTAYADYRWQAKSRMRMQVDGGRPKFRTAETRKVTFAGKTFHRAEATFTFRLDPGQKTFKLTIDRGEKTRTETVEITCPPFKVLSASLKYAVEDKPTCPKKVTETATFETTRPGWVNHEIRMQGGLVVSSGKLTAKRVGNRYVATAVRHLTVGAIDKDFIADAIGSPANSGWTRLRVTCLELSGDFSFVDHGSPTCPRRSEALITFRSNMPDRIGYSLDCTNGISRSGEVTPVKTVDGIYVGAAVEAFQIDKTTVYSCALKSTKPGPVKLHKWKSHTYKCVHRAVETGPAGLHAAPKPAGQATPLPPRVWSASQAGAPIVRTLPRVDRMRTIRKLRVQKPRLPSAKAMPRAAKARITLRKAGAKVRARRVVRTSGYGTVLTVTPRVLPRRR